MSGAWDSTCPVVHLGIQKGGIRYSQFVRYRMNNFLRYCAERRGEDPSRASQFRESGICGVSADAYLVSRLKSSSANLSMLDFDFA